MSTLLKACLPGNTDNRAHSERLTGCGGCCSPKVSEAELAAIARGAGGPDLDADVAYGAGGDATRRLLGEYETPNR